MNIYALDYIWLVDRKILNTNGFDQNAHLGMPGSKYTEFVALDIR